MSGGQLSCRWKASSSDLDNEEHGSCLFCQTKAEDELERALLAEFTSLLGVLCIAQGNAVISCHITGQSFLLTAEQISFFNHTLKLRPKAGSYPLGTSAEHSSNRMINCFCLAHMVEILKNQKLLVLKLCFFLKEKEMKERRNKETRKQRQGIKRSKPLMPPPTLSTNCDFKTFRDHL